MKSKPVLLAMSRHLILVCAASMSASVAAQSKIASDKDNYSGDHIRVQTHLKGFKESSRDSTVIKCAPANSGLSVLRDDGEKLTVRFYDVPKVNAEKMKETDLGKECLTVGFVSEDASYTIDRKVFLENDYKRSGVTFGGLVIPFKFRLGGDKAVSSSSTVAPYLGFTSRYLQGFGLSLNPVIAGGVALVPVTNPATGQSESKTGFSFGLGFVLKSSKNDEFSAGLIIGKDVMSSSDRALDPNINEPWISFYLGVSM